MNKTQLLADLAARPYISEVGTPENMQPVGEEGQPNEGQIILNWDGSSLYHVPIRQVSGIGTASGGLGICQFYVVDEGQPGETAYYKDSPPTERARPSAIKEWILGIIFANANSPNSYRGFTVWWVSERAEMVVYSILAGTPLVAQYWYVRKGHGNATQITGTAAEISLYLNTLKGSLLNV